VSCGDDVAAPMAEPRAPTIDERLAEILEIVTEIFGRLTTSYRNPTGERHPRSRLTERLVREARALKRTGLSYAEVRARLSLPTSQSATAAAITGRTWKHVSDQPNT
jgi:predicted RNA polymerase sigma factor